MSLLHSALDHCLARGIIKERFVISWRQRRASTRILPASLPKWTISISWHWPSCCPNIFLQAMWSRILFLVSYKTLVIIYFGFKECNELRRRSPEPHAYAKDYQDLSRQITPKQRDLLRNHLSASYSEIIRVAWLLRHRRIFSRLDYSPIPAGGILKRIGAAVSLHHGGAGPTA